MDKSISEIKLLSKTPRERKEFLDNEISKFPDILNIEEDLQKGKKIERILESGLNIHDLIKDKEVPSDEDVRKIFKKFEKDFLNGISEKLLNPKSSVYTLAKTPLLSKANTLTRSFSTDLGAIWEDIAFLSPKVISTEKFFDGLKIRGVDFIVINDKEFCFCQIKTMKGTLTGSQKPRSEKELKIYKKSKFIAALELGSWTFNSSFVPRVSGRDFWNLIDLDYDLIIKNAKNLLSTMEDYLKNNESDDEKII